MADVVELGHREPEVDAVADPARSAGGEVPVVQGVLAHGVGTAELENHHRDLA
jgi:hypothetical protein